MLIAYLVGALVSLIHCLTKIGDEVTKTLVYDPRTYSGMMITFLSVLLWPVFMFCVALDIPSMCREYDRRTKN